MQHESVTVGVAVGVARRVCRANGCYSIIAGAMPGEGRGGSSYCSDACRVRASRRGKAASPYEKVVSLHHQGEGVMIQIRELEARLKELAEVHSGICNALEVAQNENLDQRKADYLNG